MTALNKQALRQLATDAHELGIIKRYTKGIEANKRFAAIATPLTVLALLDAMEAAENNLIDSECHVAELEESLRDKQALLEALDNALCEILPGTQYMDPPDGGNVTPLEQVRRMVADYRERIAILESRKVCVPRISNDEFWLSFNNRIVFREETYRSAVIKSIEAAGIGVKGE